MAKDVYLQPNAPDPVLNSEFVLSLVRRYVGDAQNVTGVDESGEEARVYLVDDQIVVKTQRPHRLRPRTSLAKEVLFLQQLAEHTEVAVPRVLGYGKEGSVEYTIMTRIAGVPMGNVAIEGEGRERALFALGRTLRRIHRIPQQAFQSDGTFPVRHTFEDVRADFRETFDSLIERLQKTNVPWNLPVSPEKLAERAMDSLPVTDERVALHSNPGPTHSFIDPQTGMFLGLIDFGDAYISHPAWDLWRWNRVADRQAVLAGYTSEYAVPRDFLATWRIVMLVADMAAIAYQREDAPLATADVQELINYLV